MSGDVPALVAQLTRPAAYPFPVPEPVEVLQTHVSVLFFAANRVYKVKKAVDLGFLDFRSLAARRHFCAEEVRLNRRLAPATYLGVVPIRRGASGALRIGSPRERPGDAARAGEVVEWAVEMVRLPADRMMSALLQRGMIDNAMLDRIVARVAAFHAEAGTGPGVDEHADPEELRRQTDASLASLADVAAPRGRRGTGSFAPVITPRLLDRLRRATGAFLDERGSELRARARAGRVREGHGDLHAGNICLDGDDVIIYDCIEFTLRFRCRDVAAEMAFLAMDLDARGFRGFGGTLVRRYGERTGDPDVETLADPFKMQFAIVRGKVSALRAADAAVGKDERDAARREAMRYLHLATTYALPPALVVMCGLPGTGKSRAARAIARPFEAVVVRSDVVRKRLAGLDPADQAGAEARADLYSAAFTERTYAAVRDEADRALARGRTVVVDATCPSAARRAPLLALAGGHGAPALLVECTARPETVRERLAARATDEESVSDADWAVYERARARWEPPDEVEAARRVTLDEADLDERAAEAALDALVVLA